MNKSSNRDSKRDRKAQSAVTAVPKETKNTGTIILKHSLTVTQLMKFGYLLVLVLVR